MIPLENSFVIFHKEKGICLWSNFNSKKNKIQVDKNNFNGQGELKIIFEAIDEIQFTQTELVLYSNSDRVSVFKTDGCLVENFINTYKIK